MSAHLAVKQTRFRLTAPIPAETELHAAIARALSLFVLPPAEWSCFPAGSVPLPPQFGAKLARMGLKRGWPDLLIVHHGIYGIEIKRPGGRLSLTRSVRTRSGILRTVEGQADVFPRLQAAGMAIAVCSSVDEVLAALGAWGVPLRGHSL